MLAWSGKPATPIEAVTDTSVPGTEISAIVARTRSAISSAASISVSGSRTANSSPPLRAGEVPGPQHAAQRRADVREDLVPRGMPALVVDLLEVVQVEQDQGERRVGRRGLRERPLQRVGDGALVGQPGEPVGGGADLRDGQVAQVGQDRRRLADRLADPLLLGLGVGRRAAEQDRADHLAADRERNAGRARRAPRRTPGRTAGAAARRSPGCVRPDRTARQERGSAPRRVSGSGEPGGSGVTASSRSALLFLFSTTALVAGRVRSRWRCSSRCASSSSPAICSVSANSAWSWPGSRFRRMRRIPCHSDEQADHDAERPPRR